MTVLPLNFWSKLVAVCSRAHLIFQAYLKLVGRRVLRFLNGRRSTWLLRRDVDCLAVSLDFSYFFLFLKFLALHSQDSRPYPSFQFLIPTYEAEYEKQGRIHGHQLRTGGQGRKCAFSHFRTRSLPTDQRMDGQSLLWSCVSATKNSIPEHEIIMTINPDYQNDKNPVLKRQVKDVFLTL